MQGSRACPSSRRKKKNLFTFCICPFWFLESWRVPAYTEILPTWSTRNHKLVSSGSFCTATPTAMLHHAPRCPLVQPSRLLSSAVTRVLCYQRDSGREEPRCPRGWHWRSLLWRVGKQGLPESPWGQASGHMQPTELPWTVLGTVRRVLVREPGKLGKALVGIGV